MAEGKQSETHHVGPNEEIGWDARRAGASTLNRHASTKAEALHNARGRFRAEEV